MLEAARGQVESRQLDPEERPTALAHSLVHRVDHAGNAVKPAPAIRERADARQHDMVGGNHVLGPRRDVDLATQAGLARCALKAFRAECKLPEP